MPGATERARREYPHGPRLKPSDYPKLRQANAFPSHSPRKLAEPAVTPRYSPNLAEVIPGGVPRLSAALGILSGVAEALVAIHGVGLVHPDLEPGNVLVAPSGWWSSTSGSPPP